MRRELSFNAMAFVLPSCLGTVTTGAHVAPSETTAPASVKKQPVAIWRTTLTDKGHVPPIVQNGRIDRLPPDGVPLGHFCQSTYTSQRQTLATGDRLVFVTDGLIESTNGNDIEYGLDSLASVAESFPDKEPYDFAERLIRDATLFRNGKPTDDDTTLMVIRRKG